MAMLLVSGFSSDKYLCFGKSDLTNVVLPDCRGPVTETTGYFLANFNNVVDNFLGIILCNFAFVLQIYINYLFCQELFVSLCKEPTRSEVK